MAARMPAQTPPNPPRQAPMRADAAVPDRPAAAGRWWLLAVLFLFYAYTYVDRMVVSLLVPDIERTLGLSDTQVGFVMGPVATVVIAVCSFPAGWIADKYPRRLVLAWAVALFAAGTIGIGLSSGFATLIMARSVASIGEAAIIPCAYSLIGDAFTRGRLGTATAIFTTGGKIGTAAALSAGGLALVYAERLIAHGGMAGYAAWQLVFLMLGLPILVGAALAFSFKDPGRRDIRQTQLARGELAAFLRKERRLFTLMLLGFSVICISSFALTSWVPAYLARIFKLSPSQYGPMLGLISIGTAIGLGIKGWLVDWFYSRGVKDIYIRLYVYVLVISSPLFICMFFITNSSLFIVTYGLTQIVTIPYLSYATTAIQVVTPSNLRARLMSIAFILFALSGGFGSFVVGVLTDHVFKGPEHLGSSLGTVLAVTGPIALICLILAMRPLRAAVEAAEHRAG